MRSAVPRFFFRAAVLGALVAVTAGAARAQFAVNAGSSTLLSGWSVNAAQDGSGDVQASQSRIDLVGDSSRFAFVAAQANDTLIFRLRLNTPESSGGSAPGVFDQVAAIGIDINHSGKADIAFAVTGKNGPGINAGQSYFMAFGDSIATSPSSTGWGSAFGAVNWTTSGASADFNYSLVSAIDGAVGNVPGSTGPNTFLTFAVSFARLQDAIRSLGGSYASFVVDPSTAGAFLFSAHTGTQTNSVNVDYIFNGQVIPELNVAYFLVAGVLPLAWWQWRSRRRLIAVTERPPAR